MPFPGDSYVDEVALDGYNWATLQPGSRWTSFADVFGDKAAWVSAMWRTLADWPQVRGVMFFDFDKEADWRIDSSAAARTAFTQGVAGYLRG